MGMGTYPSPNPTFTLTWIRGGVGVQFLRYWH